MGGLFRDFYWRSQLLLLPASGLYSGQEEQPKTLSVYSYVLRQHV